MRIKNVKVVHISKGFYMAAQLPYPRLITADLHAHERNNKARMREVGALIKRMSEIREQYQAQTLIVNGDLFDRNTPLAVDSIVALAQFFRTFKHTVIVVGNHDTPVRAASRTMLDIFALVGATVIGKTTVIGNDLFIPYYDQHITHPVDGKFDHIHMHKDMRELNGYADAEFGIDMTKLPPCTACFNGHLHSSGTYKMPNGGIYVQCGAPYPTSWGDDAQANNSIWVATEPSKFGAVQAMITCDADNHDAEKYAYTRKRAEKVEGGEENPLTMISDVLEETLMLDKVLAMTSFEPRVNNIIRSSVRHALNKVDAIRV